MSRYALIVSPAADKQLHAINDRKLLLRLKAAIFALADEPRPPKVVKLEGEEDQWRIRVGDWRVIYVIEDGRLVVLVVTVKHRREVYR